MIQVSANELIMVYQAGASTTVFALLAKWFVWPFLRRLDFAHSQMALLSVHLFRQVGSTCLAPTVVPNSLSRAFGWTVTIGDFLCMVLAAIAMVALRRSWGSAVALIWAFTAVGALHFTVVGIYAATIHAIDYLSAHWYVAGYYVPLLFVSHVLVTIELIQRSGARRDS